MQKPKKILFIYNANSDTGSQLFDFAHKVLSPTTYECSLCALTFGKFTEKKKWKKFRELLNSKGFELSFLHKDEFQKTYKSKFGHSFTFPIVLLETDYDLEIAIGTQQLNTMERVEELIEQFSLVVNGF